MKSARIETDGMSHKQLMMIYFVYVLRIADKDAMLVMQIPKSTYYWMKKKLKDNLHKQRRRIEIIQHSTPDRTPTPKRPFSKNLLQVQ